MELAVADAGAIAVYNFNGYPQLLRIVDSVITGNRAVAHLWNGVAVTGPLAELTLADSRIGNNALMGGRDIERRGGGLFTTLPVS